jgi:hypothetical protein
MFFFVVEPNVTLGPFSEFYGICPEDCPGSRTRIMSCSSSGEWKKINFRLWKRGIAAL